MTQNPHAENEREALLTAYALGETDDAQTAEVEALLDADAAVRAQVEEIRATAALLTTGLAAEVDEHLPAAAREAVTAAAEPAPAGRVRSLWPLVGMAASVAAGVGLAGWLAQRPARHAETARAYDSYLLPELDDATSGLRPTSARQRERGLQVIGEKTGYATGRRDPRQASREGASVIWNTPVNGVVPETPAPAASPARRPASTIGYIAGDTKPGDTPGLGRGTFFGSGGAGGGSGAREADPNAAPGGATRTFDRAAPEETVALAPGQRRGKGGVILNSNDAAFERANQLAEGTLAGAEVRLVRGSADGTVVADAEVAEVVRRYAEIADRRAQDLRIRHGVRYGLPGSESYEHPGDSTFRDPANEPLSTFSIDVDTASYANVRRFLNNGQLPPAAAVRVEEMVNYFTYSDPRPQGAHPIAATLETATCPWNTASRLVRVGVKAKTFDEPPPAANLVFLIDVSGSMRPADKLPLLQRAMKMLTDQMREGDRVAIVTYSNNAGVRLQSTDGSEKDAIKACIDGLSAGGGTNGGGGIVDAYRIARENLIEGGINRVILATDGDFNVGVTDRNDLNSLIEKQRESGVFLSVLGVGTGNLKDATLEILADRGNGNYHYLDGLREARKVLVDDLMGTVVTVAKDVKIQIEFNPVTVGAYRLIGYENRMLAAADFNDDTKDAGEMGAGHTVTALYEIVPAGTSPQPGVDPLRYQKAPPRESTDAAQSGELLTLKVRYKLPDGDASTRFDMTLTDSGAKFDEASEDLRFASAVASFGMLLRGSPAAAGTSYDAVLELAQGAIGTDPGGHRAEFLDLALKAKKLSGR